MAHSFLSFLFTEANGNTRQAASLTLSVNRSQLVLPPFRNSPIRFTIHKLLDAISPSYQSVFQLSLEVLVYYRCFTDIQFWKQLPSLLHVEIPPNTTRFLSRTCKFNNPRRAAKFQRELMGIAPKLSFFKNNYPLLYLHVDKLTIPLRS